MSAWVLTTPLWGLAGGFARSDSKSGWDMGYGFSVVMLIYRSHLGVFCRGEWLFVYSVPCLLIQPLICISMFSWMFILYTD